MEMTRTIMAQTAHQQNYMMKQSQHLMESKQKNFDAKAEIYSQMSN